MAFGGYLAGVGNSASNEPRRRYARPGEFEIPTQIPETKASLGRPGAEPNPNLKSPAFPTCKEAIENKGSIFESNSFNERFGAELNPTRKSLTQPPTGVRVDAAPNPIRRSPDPLTGYGGLRARQRHVATGLTRTPADSIAEASFGGAPDPVRRAPAPAPCTLLDHKPLSGRPKPLSKVPATRYGGDTIDRKKVRARFELLPDQKPSWDRIGWSAAAQLAFLSLALLSPTIFPRQMQTALKFDAVELMQPVTHIHIPPTPPPPPTPRIKPEVRPRELKPILPKPKPVVIEAPKLNPSQPHIFLVLKPEVPKQPHIFLILKPEVPEARRLEAKPVELKPVFQPTEIVMASKQPVRPKEEVKTNVGSGGVAPATLAAPANQVQGGGFGDPNGVPGPGNPNKAANINQVGSPNLPGGPGNGNGSGGAQGMRGTVASQGAKKGPPGTEGGTTGVAILYMPNPAYSMEARTRKMEGDVVLEVVFLASSQVEVVRVVSGLGFGLDEAAIQAAKLIRFRPAKRDGQSVDFPARVRIEFRMAQ